MPVDPVVELVYGRKPHEIQLDELIAAHERLITQNFYPERNVRIQKYIGFIKYFFLKECNTLDDVYSNIRNGVVPENVMSLFIEEEQFPIGLKSIVLEGYPNMKFPEEIMRTSQNLYDE